MPPVIRTTYYGDCPFRQRSLSVLREHTCRIKPPTGDIKCGTGKDCPLDCVGTITIARGKDIIDGEHTVVSTEDVIVEDKEEGLKEGPCTHSSYGG